MRWQASWEPDTQYGLGRMPHGLMGLSHTAHHIDSGRRDWNEGSSRAGKHVGVPETPCGLLNLAWLGTGCINPDRCSLSLTSSPQVAPLGFPFASHRMGKKSRTPSAEARVVETKGKLFGGLEKLFLPYSLFSFFLSFSSISSSFVVFLLHIPIFFWSSSFFGQRVVTLPGAPAGLGTGMVAISGSL